MWETTEEMRALEDLLDASYGQAGAHLRAIHTEAARLTAADVVAHLHGMRVLVVATVSAGGRPFTGPVDGYFVGGRWHLATSPDAVRTRHLAVEPAISATYVEGEAVVVTVHGHAEPVDLHPDTRFWRAVTEHHDGDVSWMRGAPAWAIQPAQMFAADMRVHTAGPS